MTTILLTGGGGMVGRNIIDLCRERGVEVVAPRRTELDLTDHASTLRFLREVRPDIVVHAAGRVGGVMRQVFDQRVPPGRLVDFAGRMDVEVAVRADRLAERPVDVDGKTRVFAHVSITPTFATAPSPVLAPLAQGRGQARG